LAPKSFRAAKELFITLPSPGHGAVSSTEPMAPHWSVRAPSFPHPWLWLAVQFPRDLLDFLVWINSENSNLMKWHTV